jgi:hypothetical protein
VAHLRRFWFSFEGLPSFSILRVGCGVTAYTYDDAVQILKDRVFEQQSLPACSVVEDIDVGALDERIRPNMGVVTQRGVWFPLGY